MDESDLHEIAKAYLSLRARDRLEYERLLLRARENAVYPLITALLNEASKQKEMISQGKPEEWPDFYNSLARDIYAETMLKPVVKQVAELIDRVGKRAIGELCRILQMADSQIVLAAALVLATKQSSRVAICGEVQFALANIQQSPNQRMILEMLKITMMRNGDIESLHAIEEHACGADISVQAWIDRTINSALICLQTNE